MLTRLIDKITQYRHLLLIVALVSFLATYQQLNIPLFTENLYPVNSTVLIYYCLLPSFLLSYLIIIINRNSPQLLSGTTKFVYLPNTPKYSPLVGYSLLSVPLQEIVFRWFLFGLILNISHQKILSIILTSLIFGLFHISFSKLLALSTFIIGLWWNYLYLTTANLWYPIISHAIIGNTLIWLALYRPSRIQHPN